MSLFAMAYHGRKLCTYLHVAKLLIIGAIGNLGNYGCTPTITRILFQITVFIERLEVRGLRHFLLWHIMKCSYNDNLLVYAS